MTQTRIVVGIDFQGRAEGALRLAEHLRSEIGDAAEINPVHVLDEGHLQYMLRHRHWDELQKDVTTACERAAEAAGVVATPPTVVRAANVALGVRNAAEGAELLVLGRKAKRDEHSLVQLGTVARRVIRNLPCPTLVTPADLLPSDMGAGPILLALNAYAPSSAAIEFARHWSSALKRDVHCVHVASLPDASEFAYVPAHYLAPMLDEMTSEGRSSAERVLAEHKLTATVDVRHGPPAAVLLDAAKDVDACMIVVGPRNLSLGERLFLSSTGSALAGASPVPVALVPPPAKA